jgi:nicotinamidase-related amidase
MDNGELGVAGSFKDIENTTRFIYNNMEKITQIAVSLDTHQPQQIFHPTWWINDKGEHPAPFTIITAKDVDDGVWRPVGKKPKASIEYVKNLEKQGKKQLCVWTYHCLEGTHGAALEGQFANMVYFHSVARKSVALRLRKGMQAATEMYGIIKAEYDPENKVNYNFLNALEKYDKIVIVGEAKSHCVLESISQILDYYKDREDVRRKIYILEDCMSSIQGFEDSTEEAFKEFKNKFSVNITKSTDLVL